MLAIMGSTLKSDLFSNETSLRNINLCYLQGLINWRQSLGLGWVHVSTSLSSRTPVHIAIVSEFVCLPALLYLEDLDSFVSSIPSGSNTLSTPSSTRFPEAGGGGG